MSISLTDLTRAVQVYLSQFGLVFKRGGTDGDHVPLTPPQLLDSDDDDERQRTAEHERSEQDETDEVQTKPTTRYVITRRLRFVSLYLSW